MNTVEVRKVTMIEREAGGYDAHVTVGTQNPDIELGTFVMENLSAPQDYKDRFNAELEDFIDEIHEKTFPVIN